MERQVKQAIIGSAIVILIIVSIVTVILVKKFTPGTEVMNLNDYYKVPENEAMIILDNAIFEQNAKVFDGIAYIELELVMKQFNDRFYWDKYENLLIYTTPTEVIKTTVGSREYQIDKNKKDAGYTIVKTVGEQVYIAVEFVSKYSDMKYQFYTEPNILMIQQKWGDYLFVNVEKTAQIRVDTDIKAEILSEVSSGAKLRVIDTGGSMKNGFIMVMTEDGIRGYIKKKSVSESFYETIESGYKAPEYTSIHKNYKINLGWHQVTNTDANANLSKLTENTKGLTTISPTWFRINSAEGTISSLASESYVEKAHSMGLEVWGLVDDFSNEVDSYDVFSRTSRREKLVNELIASAIRFNLDGINIDFENVRLDAGPHYIQFLRELSIKCRINKLVLSVDNYVPASYSKYYDREEQGAIVDYVIIMAYDEHNNNSEQAGSVSSISYVDNAIKATLEMVPADKLIIAIPFYTRLWKETTELGKQVLSSEALGMDSAEKTLEKNNVKPVWDQATGQYYAEYKKNDILYKIWMEEEESIEAKMKLIHEADIAGVACWRLGFEKSSIWNVIQKYVN